MHILETAKIQYFKYLQLTYTKQTKKQHFFSKFGNYSKGIFRNHLPANSYQNVKLCDIAEIWKKLKMVVFYKKNFVKSHFKTGITKIAKMTG